MGVVSDVIERVDFVLLEAELDDTPCESVYERECGFPSHAATWYASASCGDIIAICERRRAKCRRDGGWWCSTDGVAGCTRFHDYESELSFDRIRADR